MYKIDNLIETFTKHAEQARKENERFLKEYKENYPDEPIPNHMKETFSLPVALAVMCREIKELKKKN